MKISNSVNFFSFFNCFKTRDTPAEKERNLKEKTIKKINKDIEYNFFLLELCK